MDGGGVFKILQYFTSQLYLPQFFYIYLQYARRNYVYNYTFFEDTYKKILNLAK